MSQPKKVFRLFANCKVVEGARRSIVCDLWHGRYDFIPNMLVHLLSEHADMSLDEIKAEYAHEHDDTIEEYYRFLQGNGYGFYTAEPHLFPPLPDDYRHPGRISNAIIDIDRQSGHDMHNILAQLDNLGCMSVQFRAYEPIDTEVWHDILKTTLTTRIPDVQVLTPFIQGIPLAEWRKLVNTHPRISDLSIHSAPEDKTEETAGQAVINLTSQPITDHSHCGLVHPSFFSINIEAYTEARQANSCLNGKISIDREGYICNCPSLPERYGHINDTSLQEALVNKDFAKYDRITKDSVSVCSDCEFRYICSDCRAFVQDTSSGTENPKAYGKPSKCRYDPYTATYSPPTPGGD